jgi:hypothetical protein
MVFYFNLYGKIINASSSLSLDDEYGENLKSSTNFSTKKLFSSEEKLLHLYSKASASINPKEYLQTKTFQSIFVCLLLKFLSSPFLSVHDQTSIQKKIENEMIKLKKEKTKEQSILENVEDSVELSSLSLSGKYIRFIYDYGKCWAYHLLRLAWFFFLLLFNIRNLYLKLKRNKLWISFLR